MLLVAFVSTFPIIFNTWTGVKAVKEIWVRSAQAMGADDRRLFVKVIVPGALPYILGGLRLGLAQAWRILVGIEMLAAVPWGLGWMIFGARDSSTPMSCWPACSSSACSVSRWKSSCSRSSRNSP